jgi:hypothetical protein
MRDLLDLNLPDTALPALIEVVNEHVATSGSAVPEATVAGHEPHGETDSDKLHTVTNRGQTSSPSDGTEYIDICGLDDLSTPIRGLTLSASNIPSAENGGHGPVEEDLITFD